MNISQIQGIEDKISKSATITIIGEDKAIENLHPYASLAAILITEGCFLLKDKENNPIVAVSPNSANKLIEVFNEIKLSLQPEPN